MALIWEKWCRLCAKDHDCEVGLFLDARGSDFMLRISKYLYIQVEKHNDLPNYICVKCSEILANFDVYANRCERVQLMFHTLADKSENRQDEEKCREVKNDFLQNFDIDENKFFPICDLKVEDDKPEEIIDHVNLEETIVKKTTRSRRITSNPIKDPDPSFVKNEVVSDTEGGDFQTFDYSSEDDYLPLSSVTESKVSSKSRKRKLPKKSSKHSSKPKRKKDNKEKHTIEVLDEISIDDMNIKMEPLSDEENLSIPNESITISDKIAISKADKKDKKERRKASSITSILKYDCHICNEDCKNWHALCVHFRDVHDTRAKVMCCCGKFLASRVSIGRHCAKHGKAHSFDCSKCGKRFPRESELTTHMITHLPKEEYPFVCCKCARRFTTQQLLRHHEKKHIPMEERMVHLCDICKSKFASKSSLLMHMKAVHERLKPFVCDQCGRAFTTKGILEEHQVRHSDARPHVCTVCHKSFKTKQRLAIHSDTHNDTVYQCPHCPIQLNSRRTLRMHLFVHDEVCRYQCNFCDKAFKRAKDLKNHSNLHTGRRPYSCPWCSRTFANGSNCRAHKRRMHPNELRISDASAAMVNKVPAPPDADAEDKKSADVAAPKVIYATVKRKLPVASTANKVPNFTFPPDVTEKDKVEPANEHIERSAGLIKSESKHIAHDMSSTKKKDEKLSPVHNYESSMSPLNLNTNSTATHKYSDLRAGTNASLTITPVSQGDESMTEFDDVSDNYHQVQNSILHSRNQIQQNYSSSADYKDSPDHAFNKTTQQLFSNFAGNNVPHNIMYNASAPALTAASFASSNPYGLHYARDEDN